jgi:hypothetical protein
VENWGSDFLARRFGDWGSADEALARCEIFETEHIEEMEEELLKHGYPCACLCLVLLLSPADIFCVDVLFPAQEATSSNIRACLQATIQVPV